MLESLRCPSCSTHYGLRPQRVQIGIHRAKCFRCGQVFDIHETVERLLSQASAESASSAGSLAEELPGLAASDLAGFDFQEEGLPEEPAAAPAEAELPPSLTPEDLKTAESAMDATLADFNAHAASDQHFSSAKDAISRLLGDAPPSAAAARPLPTSRNANPMDVEATLEALESTLGGQPSDLPKQAPGVDLSSTVRINAQDIQAALAQPPLPEEEANPSAQTLSMPLPQIPEPPRPMSAPALPPPQPAPITIPTAQDPNLLKLKIGEDLYENLSADQIATWIEQGRVLDNHMVARQFSENWIEAVKVPTLRPVFDRMKRLHSVLSEGATAPMPTPEPVRKSLFGGLFGRN